MIEKIKDWIYDVICLLMIMINMFIMSLKGVEEDEND